MNGAFRLLTAAALSIAAYGGGSDVAAAGDDGSNRGIVDSDEPAADANATVDGAPHAKNRPPHDGTAGESGATKSAPPRLGTTGRKPGSGLDWGVGSGAGSFGQRGPNRK